jgi:hypothetical protein
MVECMRQRHHEMNVIGHHDSNVEEVFLPMSENGMSEGDCPRTCWEPPLPEGTKGYEQRPLARGDVREIPAVAVSDRENAHAPRIPRLWRLRSSVSCV